MTNPLRFAVATNLAAGARAVAELLAALGKQGLRNVQPVFASSYFGLHESMDHGIADLAWCPPLVARDLVRAGAVDPIAIVMRKADDHYYAALLAHPESKVRHLLQVKGAEIGWVSKLSASGYVVARDYLLSSGVPLLFRAEKFFHTHAGVADALVTRKVDVIATYAALRDEGFRVHPQLRFARILGAAGPIPGDVIVASRSLGAAKKDEIARALFSLRVQPDGALAKLMDASRFCEVPPQHLEPLSKWTERSMSAPLRPLLARAE